jgi:hypothetical protein
MTAKTKSRFFRVAVEGDTTDGRAIARRDIEQMAQSFDAGTYGARVWLEHIRGFTADSPFRAYGDVVAVKAEAIADGELKGRLALYAQIEPTADLIALNHARQKIYTSIEMQPDFPATGGTYLVGLAVTDSPASLGTEMLSFSATAPVNPLAARKLAPANLFSVASETVLEFVDEGTDRPTLFSRVTELLNRASGRSRTDLADVHQAVETVATAITQETDVRTAREQQFARALTTLQEQLASQQQAFTALTASLEQTPATDFTRTPATGGDQSIRTDC